MPSEAQVRAVMADIHQVIEENEFCGENTLNADETGIFFGAPPKHQFIPESASRAAAPASDEKARFTTLEMGGADGKMAPSFHVIKCQSKTANDLTKTTVVDNIHRAPGFRAQDGWEKKTWEKTLELERKKGANKEKYSVTFKRPYIQHKEKLITVTCQNKAWMDTAGIAMWAETLLGPYVKKLCDGKALLVWDNCGPHNVPALKQVFESINVVVKNLPPNMTDVLQVMDLVVNAPLKSAIRSHRCEEIFDYFQAWKMKRLQELAKPAQQRKFETWQPPKPKLVDGLRTVIEVEETTLATEKFQDSMRKCFVAVGLSRSLDGTFNQYHEKRAGALQQMSPLHLTIAREEKRADFDSFTLGDVAAEVEFAKPPIDLDARELDEDGEGEMSEGDEEEDNVEQA